MNIALIHTSRGRPGIAAETMTSWLSQLSRAEMKSIRYYLGIETCELEKYIPHIDSVKKFFPCKIRVLTFEGQHITYEDMLKSDFKWPLENEIPKYLTVNTKYAALARIAIEEGADWLVVIADNLHPAGLWFDLRLSSLFDTFKDDSKILAYNCQAMRKLICHAIFTPKWFKWNEDTVQYQGYYHLHGDAEAYLKSMLANNLVVLPPSLDPTHKHALFETAPADNTFWMSNNQATHKQSETIFFRRRRGILAQYGLRDIEEK